MHARIAMLVSSGFMVAVALLCAAAQPARAAGSAVFGGTTQALDIMTIRADSRAQRVHRLVIAFEARCTDGRRYVFVWPLRAVAARPDREASRSTLPMTRNARGRFAGVQVTHRRAPDGSSAHVDLRVRGGLAKRSASGTIRANVQLLDANGSPVARCATGTIRFWAVRRPRSVYAGTTSQRHPVVARLNARRTRLRPLQVSWRAPCRPSGIIRVPDYFASLRVRHGRFSEKFDETIRDDDGREQRYSYEIRGTVTRAVVTGALKVRVTTSASAEHPASECATRVTWRATTG